jgi:branched-chain amino acid transport system substrate-binding protein
VSDVMRRLQHALAVLLLLGAGAAGAQQSVKIGVVAEFSGPFADYGAQIVGGMKTYLNQNGDAFGGRKIEIVIRIRPAHNPTWPSVLRRSS